uniref:Xol-1_GHMP-like domain-containing protein n=2 Tax=Caenorhabditis tropicalis TaxID=1561998 RepID=A0A1I7USG1_9PELO
MSLEQQPSPSSNVEQTSVCWKEGVDVKKIFNELPEGGLLSMASHTVKLIGCAYVMDSDYRLSYTTLFVAVWKLLQVNEHHIGDENDLETRMYSIFQEHDIEPEDKEAVFRATVEGSSYELFFKTFPEDGRDRLVRTKAKIEKFTDSCDLVYLRTDAHPYPVESDACATFSDCDELKLKFTDDFFDADDVAQNLTVFSKKRLAMKNRNKSCSTLDIDLFDALSKYYNENNADRLVKGFEVQPGGVMIAMKKNKIEKSKFPTIMKDIASSFKSNVSEVWRTAQVEENLKTTEQEDVSTTLTVIVSEPAEKQSLSQKSIKRLERRNRKAQRDLEETKEKAVKSAPKTTMNTLGVVEVKTIEADMEIIGSQDVPSSNVVDIQPFQKEQNTSRKTLIPEKQETSGPMESVTEHLEANNQESRSVAIAKTVERQLKPLTGKSMKILERSNQKIQRDLERTVIETGEAMESFDLDNQSQTHPETLSKKLIPERQNASAIRPVHVEAVKPDLEIIGGQESPSISVVVERTEPKTSRKELLQERQNPEPAEIEGDETPETSDSREEKPCCSKKETQIELVVHSTPSCQPSTSQMPSQSDLNENMMDRDGIYQTARAALIRYVRLPKHLSVRHEEYFIKCYSYGGIIHHLRSFGYALGARDALNPFFDWDSTGLLRDIYEFFKKRPQTLKYNLGEEIKFFTGRCHFYQAKKESKHLLRFYDMILGLESITFRQDLTYMSLLRLNEADQAVLDQKYFETLEQTFYINSNKPFDLDISEQLPIRISEMLEPETFKRFLKHVEPSAMTATMDGKEAIEANFEDSSVRQIQLFDLSEKATLPKDWSPERTRTFLLEMLSSLDKLEQSAETELYRGLYLFLLEIDSNVIDMDVFVYCNEFKINPSKCTINHHKFVLTPWFLT